MLNHITYGGKLMYIYGRQLLAPKYRRPFQHYYHPNPTQAVGEFAVQGLGQKIISDPIAEIGHLLWKWAAAGATVAIYNSTDPEQSRRAIEWAKREYAIGVKAKKIEAAELSFGKATA